MISIRKHAIRRHESRSGSVLVLAAATMVMVMAFVVFTVDLGYIALTKTQLHNAADAAVLGAGIELPAGLGLDATLSEIDVEEIASQAAVDVAALQRSGNLDSAYLNASRDVRFGKRDWDPVTNNWQDTWDTGPYNMVEVTTRRDQEYFQYCDYWFRYDHSLDQWYYEGEGAESAPNQEDSTLPLFFGPVIGHDSVPLKIASAAALLPGSGFRSMGSGSQQNAPILPITLDVPSWEDLLNGVGDDDYAYDPSTGQVTSGSDGILEVNIYPTAAPAGNGSNQWTPGNRGTVDLGNPNNATPDLKRQILEGLNENDLSYFNGEIRFDQGPIDVNGDPGISAAIKTQLTAIIGQPRAMPLFTSVTGQGNNTWYTLVKFVGIRIVAVKLTGGNKYVIVQPATLVHPTVIPGGATIAESSIFAPLRLVR